MNPDWEQSAIDNLDLVRAITMQVHRRISWVDRDDLYADGCEGLLQAARRYDPSNENEASFRTFAATRIRGQMMDGVRRLHGRSMSRNRVATPEEADLLETDAGYGGALSAVPDDFVDQLDQRAGVEFVLDEVVEPHLTRRQSHLVRELRSGKSQRQIAYELGITESAVSIMMRTIRSRLARRMTPDQLAAARDAMGG
jgi:RNA polymerase sigma factor (sigma-70 family)